MNREQDYGREERWRAEEARRRTGQFGRAYGQREFREEYPREGMEGNRSGFGEQYGSPHDQPRPYRGEHQRGYERPGWREEESYGSGMARGYEGEERGGRYSSSHGNDFDDRYDYGRPDEFAHERDYSDYGSSHDQRRDWNRREGPRGGYDYGGQGRYDDYRETGEEFSRPYRNPSQMRERRGGFRTQSQGRADDRQGYYEWLQEHRNEPPETEGERQLEGLQEEWRERGYRGREATPQRSNSGPRRERRMPERSRDDREDYYRWLDEHRFDPAETEGERELEGLQQEWRNRPRPRRSSQEINGPGRYLGEARSPREQYEQWLEDHRGNDVESEGERQLEGLQPQHQWHASDQRSRRGEPSRQPRSQRRYDEPPRSTQTTQQSYAASAPRVDRPRPRAPGSSSGRGVSARAARPGNAPAGRRRSE